MPVQRQQKITSSFQQSESQKATSETAKPKTKLKKPTSASVKTDIVISIKVQHMDNIVSRVKNHEFRKYNIPSIVERMWYVDIYYQVLLDTWCSVGCYRFYVSAPDQTLRYVAVIRYYAYPLFAQVYTY